jgi:hypothetical protein
MTFNGRCSMPRLAVLAIVASLLSACGTAGSDRAVSAVRPPMVEYSAEVQARAAAELEVLPEGSVVGALLSDYAVTRDQARVCDAH